MNGVAKMPKVGMQPIRRRQLIDATLEAINEVGMHDATIAQIARRAGVSTGIISHYFKDKNGLLEATMRDITGQLRDAVLSRLRALPDGSAEQRLQAIVGGNFDETQTSGAAMKAWLAFWASSKKLCWLKMKFVKDCREQMAKQKCQSQLEIVFILRILVKMFGKR